MNSSTSNWSPDRKNTSQQLVDVDSNLHGCVDIASVASPKGLAENAEPSIVTLSETTTTQESSIECTDDHSKAIAVAAPSTTPSSECVDTVCNVILPGTTMAVDHSAAASECPGFSLGNPHGLSLKIIFCFCLRRFL